MIAQIIRYDSAISQLVCTKIFPEPSLLLNQVNRVMNILINVKDSKGIRFILPYGHEFRTNTAALIEILPDETQRICFVDICVKQHIRCGCGSLSGW